MNEYESQIIESVKSHQVVILTGETGSGKSTQIPQILYRNGFEWMIYLMHRFLKKGGIAISQPRRVAATNLARRVCDEMHFTLGKEVGYTIRYASCLELIHSFDDTSCAETLIKYITDGCLVRECISDPLLSRYEVVMLDEAHDRSINTDILFGLCKQILEKRPDLHLIITSATLDTSLFQSFYPDSACLEIPGRMYPVAIYHSKDNLPATSDDAIEKVVSIVERLHSREPGHVLVFLPGQREIDEARNRLEKWYQDKKRKDSSGMMN